MMNEYSEQMSATRIVVTPIGGTVYAGAFDGAQARALVEASA